MAQSSISAGRALLLIGAVVLALGFASDAFLVGLESFWAYCDTATHSQNNRTLRFEAGLARIEPGSVDTLVLGSSVARDAVAPAGLAGSLGLEPAGVRKLFLAAGFASEIAMLADEYVSLQPRQVVFPVTIWSLHEKLGHKNLRFYDPLIAAKIFSLREVLGNRAEHASGLLGSAHVVVRHRRALRELLWISAFGKSNRPAFLPAELLPPQLLLSTETRRATTAEDFSCGAVNVRALSLLGQRLKASGIRFVVVATPVKSPWQDSSLVRERFEACFESISQGGAFDYFSFADGPSLEGEDFKDADHLSPRGRNRFTARLGTNLKQLDRGSADAF